MTALRQESSPSLSPISPSVDRSANELAFLMQFYDAMDQKYSMLAESIFDSVVAATDNQIAQGQIPCLSENKEIRSALMVVNRLFKLSRHSAYGGYNLIDQETVAGLDKKTYAMAMMFDGGESFRLFCDIVNKENEARVPKTVIMARSVRVEKAFGDLFDVLDKR